MQQVIRSIEAVLEFTLGAAFMVAFLLCSVYVLVAPLDRPGFRPRGVVGASFRGLVFLGGIFGALTVYHYEFGTGQLPPALWRASLLVFVLTSASMYLIVRAGDGRPDV